jgi:hypothetical protein
MSKNTINGAVTSILGKKLANSIIEEMGIHWAVVVALAQAKDSDTQAVATIYSWQDNNNWDE